MDDIIVAQKIVGNTYSNISNKAMFHEYSSVYKSSNEMLSKINKYTKEKKDILTVTASGDQILNFICNGTINIDTFDISRFASYFLFLKLAAIKNLTKDEYIEFFFEAIFTYDEKYDDMYYTLRKDLNKKAKDFWDSLFDYFDWYDIYNSYLFSSDEKSIGFIEKENIYLKEKNYNKLKDMIDKVNINIYNSDIFTLEELYKNKYDLIYLSNIINYVDKIKYRELLSKFNLKENGTILTYFFDINENIKKLFLEENYKFYSFKDTTAKVMQYKNK